MNMLMKMKKERIHTNKAILQSDSLFSKIFDLFVNQRISSYEIDKAKGTKEILNEIKKRTI